MIAVYDFLWLRLADYITKYQSGMDAVASFNGKLDEVQREVYTDLSPYYQSNEKIRKLLEPWVKSYEGTSTNGVVTFPTGDSNPIVDRIVAMAITDNATPKNILYEVNPITEGELVYANRVPQRKPDVTKKRVYYYNTAEITKLAPLTALPYRVYYLVYPALAKIVFDYTETDDEFVMTYNDADSIDLAWNISASNIILYKMLEKYGISNRENLLQEYSRLGISETMGGKQA